MTILIPSISYKSGYLPFSFLLSFIAILQVVLILSPHTVEKREQLNDGLIPNNTKSQQRFSHATTSEAFNNTNPHKESWCPSAMCYNSPLCVPCNRRYLFILATGRSGSTTLLRMFNELPNIRLAGENLNQLYFASQLVANLENDNHFVSPMWVRKGKYMKPKIDGPFQHNALPIGHMSCAFQNLLNALNP